MGLLRNSHRAQGKLKSPQNTILRWDRGPFNLPKSFHRPHLNNKAWHMGLARLILVEALFYWGPGEPLLLIAGKTGNWPRHTLFCWMPPFPDGPKTCCKIMIRSISPTQCIGKYGQSLVIISFSNHIKCRAKMFSTTNSGLMNKQAVEMGGGFWDKNPPIRYARQSAGAMGHFSDHGLPIPRDIVQRGDIKISELHPPEMDPQTILGILLSFIQLGFIFHEETLLMIAIDENTTVVIQNWGKKLSGKTVFAKSWEPCLSNLFAFICSTLFSVFYRQNSFPLGFSQKQISLSLAVFMRN